MKFYRDWGERLIERTENRGRFKRPEDKAEVVALFRQALAFPTAQPSALPAHHSGSVDLVKQAATVAADRSAATGEVYESADERQASDAVYRRRHRRQARPGIGNWIVDIVIPVHP